MKESTLRVLVLLVGSRAALPRTAFSHGRRGWQAATSVLLLLACSGCSSLSHGLMAPRGPVADAEKFLFFLSIAIILVVVLPVLVLTPWLVWRYRRNAGKSAYRPKWEFSMPLEFLSWGVPIAVTAVLLFVLWHQAFKLDPYRPLPSNSKPLQVQVVSLDWKWLFIYPSAHIAAANELAIPVGRPVHLTLTSDTVMQALMIPRLAGQIYTMAGMQTQLYIQADHAGQYRGENTQYNGAGFQQQKFRTLALAGKDFAQWVKHVQHSAGSLDCTAYAGLQKRAVLAGPRHYSSVQPELFDWIIAKYRVHPAPACGTGIREDQSGTRENPHE